MQEGTGRSCSSFKRSKVTGGSFARSLLTGKVARGEALAAKPEDPSAIPGIRVTEEH